MSNEHYFAPSPESELKLRTIHARIAGTVYELQTSAMGPQPGVGGGAQPAGTVAPPPWHTANPFEMLKTKCFVLLTHAMSEKYLARAAGAWHPWL